MEGWLQQGIQPSITKNVWKAGNKSTLQQTKKFIAQCHCQPPKNNLIV